MKDSEGSKLQLISEEAAEWFVRIKDRDIDAAEQRKYVKWLKQSPTHVAEFLRLSQNYVQYRRADIPRIIAEEGAASNVIELIHGGESLKSMSHLTRPTRWKIAATIATVALSLLLGIVAKISWFDRNIATGAGEWRQVALADGSTMRVAPLTELKIEFSDERRSVHLLSGQAFFQVAKDKARPFIVNSGLAAVRAIGTEFAVSRLATDVVVTVREGTVAVIRTGTKMGNVMTDKLSLPPIEVPLSADEQVKVSSRAWPAVVMKVNASRELAWARQRLEFENETIAEAVAAFNRLNRVQIVVDDPEIAQWRACCVFDATDPESFAESMAADPGVALVRDGRGVIHLVAEGVKEYPGKAKESATIKADAH